MPQENQNEKKHSDITANHDLLAKCNPEQVNKMSDLVEQATGSMTTSLYHDTILHPPKTINEGQVAVALPWNWRKVLLFNTHSRVLRLPLLARKVTP